MHIAVAGIDFAQLGRELTVVLVLAEVMGLPQVLTAHGTQL